MFIIILDVQPSSISPRIVFDPLLAMEDKNLIMVLLVGAPGSGKSAFCNDVLVSGHRPWVRICQDTIANGKPGTKLKCLATAATELKDGKNLIIDRCNLEKKQRSDFLKLGRAYAELHAVVLDLPAKLCISRSVKRTEHEGNLQGGKAAAVVNMMLRKKQMPKLSEGFSRITVCRNENDVKDVVNMYCELGPSDTLPAGIFGQTNTDAKDQGQESSSKSSASEEKDSQHHATRQDSRNNSSKITLRSRKRKEEQGGSSSACRGSADFGMDKTSTASPDIERKMKRKSSRESVSNKKCKGSRITTSGKLN